MAGLGVELLVGLVLLLLLLPVRGWEPIDESKLLSLYEAGRWTDARGFSSEGYGYEPIPEDELPEVEGAATSNMDAFGDHGFHVAGGGPVLTNLPSSTDGQYEVEFVDAPPRSWTSSTSLGSNGLDVVCSENGFQITLHTGQLSEVRVLGSTDMLPVMDAPESCGYDVNPLRNTLTVPFGGCHVKHSFQTDSYGLELLYINEFGRTQVATAYCEESLKFDPGLHPRSDKPKEKCLTPPPAQNCAVATGERVYCGESQISSAYCEKIGCCVDSVSSVCYYPLDECTGDQHFVFAIRFDSASIPVDPTELVIPGYPNCKPVHVNDKVAIFKFNVTECGTRAYEVGETKIYLAEVQSVVQALNLKYGVITRSDALKFMVECRYSKDGNTQQSLASVGYMVMTPSSTLPSSVIASGLYAVQLRIATDSTYSSYLPTYQQPLRLLLGKPVYLELYLNTPLPKAVILVNYCLAYPFSAKNALVLVYERCANPFDPNVSILQVSDAVKSRYTKRFMVTAFQFMDQTTNKYLDEEIYFMCSTEVCFPSEKICEERCI